MRFTVVFLYLFIFTLNFFKDGCNGREEDGVYLFFTLYMFLYMFVKHVVDIQALILQRGWKKFAILSLVYKKMGHEKRNI